MAGASAALRVSAFVGPETLPLQVAGEQGLFAAERLEVRWEAETSSIRQMTGLIDGAFDIAMTAIDNVVAYDEGQGAVPVEGTPDLVAFLGSASEPRPLVAAPGIATIAELRGRRIAVDALNTGFSFLLRRMLEEHGGLSPADYELVAIGAPPARWQAVQAGDCAAALLSRAFTAIAIEAGCRELAVEPDPWTRYQGGVYCARRSWCEANGDAVRGFIRAVLAAVDWIREPASRATLPEALRRHLPHMPAAAAEAVAEELHSPRSLLQPGLPVNLDGVRTVLALREAYATPRRAPGPPEKYLDMRFYEEATRGALAQDDRNGGGSFVMAISPADSAIYRTLLSDDEVATLFSDVAEIRAMLAAEAALAEAQAACGVIPAEAAASIAKALPGVEIGPASLSAGTAAAGVPVGPLVAAARRAIGGEAAQWLHFGATSQDIVDTALVLRLRDALDILATRLDELIAQLAARADEHRATVMTARTRWQQATPTTFGLKIAGWLSPLAAHRTRLDELRPRLLVVQLGGAAGNLAAMGDAGLAVMEEFAARLGLAAPALPWHTARDSVAELAGWLSLVTGSLGKMGRDLVLLAQNEVGEVRAGTGGGSSTMPQKANPVAAEALLTLARQNAGLIGAMHQALVAEHERSGEAWTLEWLTLPQMTVATAAALHHGCALAATLVADPGRMRANMDASDGMLLAEACAFALAAHMPRPEAQALVAAACAEAAAEGRHLIETLRARTDAPVDWEALAEPASYLGAADALVDRAIAASRETLP